MNAINAFELELAGGVKNYSRDDWNRTRLGIWVPPTGAIRADLDIYVKGASYVANRHAWRAAMARAFGCCEICGEQKKLEAHHLHYRTVGSESLWDFLVLCRKCHYSEHCPTRFHRGRWIKDPERYQAELWIERKFNTRSLAYAR